MGWFIGIQPAREGAALFELTRIRQRWGEEQFRKIFRRSVAACLKAKIALGEVVQFNASLIRANVSWESLIERHVEMCSGENHRWIMPKLMSLPVLAFRRTIGRKAI